MSKFKKGDLVVLKSGSPDMTVVGVYEKNSSAYAESMAYEAYTQKFGECIAIYSCNWFEGNKKYEGVFPEESLETSEE